MSTPPQPLTESICRTYWTALLFIGVVALFLPSFSAGAFLVTWYVLLTVLALGTLGMCGNVRFQRLHRRLRPFIVGRILQCIATLFLAGVALEGIQQAIITQAWVPYGMFWLLAVTMTSRYYRIFRLAADAKHKAPDRCEFC